MGRILAIDYGAKRVGLAVSDTLMISANGLPTIDRTHALKVIIKYTKEEDVDKIIIGYPTNFDGSSTHATELVDRFIKELHTKVPSIPVIKRDEAYTSKTAVRTMVEMGVKKKERKVKGNIDKMSAVLILQEYLQTL